MGDGTRADNIQSEKTVYGIVISVWVVRHVKADGDLSMSARMLSKLSSNPRRRPLALWFFVV